jgi:hypothetical protein
MVRRARCYAGILGMLMTAWLTLLLAPLAHGATATLDRDTISLDETVTLTITIDSASIFGNPDWSVLEKDFHVLGTNRRTQVINDDASTQWTVVLSPKHEGKIRIPPIKVSGERTQAIEVNVTTKSAAASDASGSLWIDVEAHKDRVYVQEQTIVTVRLGTAIDLLEAPTVQKPDIPNVVFEVLNSTQYTKRINGTRYTVFEIKCAFFPDRSGALVIPPFVAQVTVPQQVQQNSSLLFQRFFNQGRRVQLKSKQLDIDVREKPAAFPANAVWLPAQSLTVSDSWSDDPLNLATGGSITRTVTLQARGSLGEQLPALPTYKLDGFKLYPDQATTDKQIDSETIIGSRVESVAMLPTRPGDFRLPEVRIPWWNVNTDSLEYATLPAITLKVHGAALSSPAPAAPPAPDTATAPASQPQPQPQPSVPGTSSQPGGAAFWPWLSAGLAAAWVVTLLLWWRSRRRPHETAPAATAITRRDDSAAWDAVRAASRNTNSAEDLRRLRNALVALATAWSPERRFAGLEFLASESDALRQQLQLLDRQLYGGESAARGFDATTMMQELQRMRAARMQRDKAPRDLPPLYPQAG